MNFTFFDFADKALFCRNDAASATWQQETLELNASFPLDEEKRIRRGQRIGFADGDGGMQVFEVYRVTTEHPQGLQTVKASHIAVAELSSEVVAQYSPTNATPANAVTLALTGTPWAVGTVSAAGIASAEASFGTVWKALCAVRDAWDVRIVPRVTFDESGITGRYIDVLAAEGSFRGLRLSMARNIDKAGVTYDDSECVTALYGYGKSSRDETAETYVDFGSVVWRKADGKPADKPAGQKYVEDAAATAAYGRNGRPRFGIYQNNEDEDPSVLLTHAWEDLQKRSKPKLSIEATVADLRSFGYTGEPMALGDLCVVEIEPEGLKVEARIVRLTIDLLNPAKTRPTLGNYMDDIVYSSYRTAQDAATGAKVGRANPSLLSGYLNTMVTSILSTGTNMYTDESDGSLVFVSEDGQAAVRITGNGLLLASSKTGSDWNWRTAINGTGMVADEITTGTLRASLVKILGNANFFWDAAAIVCQNPQKPQQQIRFGLYDGTHYGIGLTLDGGKTWVTSMDFEGIHAQSVFAKDIQVGTINGQDAGYIGGHQIGSRAVGSGNVGYGAITTETIAGKAVTGPKLYESYAKLAAFNELYADVAAISNLLAGYGHIESAWIDHANIQSMGFAAGGNQYRSVQWVDPSGATRVMGQNV